MEAIEPRLTVDLAKVGLFAIAHVAIFLNREVLRPKIQSEKYDAFSVQVEHILSHLTLAMGGDGLMDAFLRLPTALPPTIITAIGGTTASWIKGVYQDLILPKEPQFDQFLSNTIGCLAYLLPSIVPFK